MQRCHLRQELNKDVKSKYFHKFISPKDINDIIEDPYDIAFNNDMSLNEIIDEYVRKDSKHWNRYLDFWDEPTEKYDWDINLEDIEEKPANEYRANNKGDYHANMQRYAFNKSSIDKSKMYCSPSPKKSKYSKNSTEK